MAVAVVSFLLNKLGAIIDEERQLLGGVRADVVSVRDELQHIITFLRAAEVMEEPKPQVTVCVNQVRDISFDIEDVLDEFVLRLAPDGRRRGRSLGCIISPFCFDLNVKYRHQIASKIRDVKPRIINVSESYKRYDQFMALQTQDQDSTYASSNLWHEQRDDALLQEGSELVGIDTSKVKLIEWLIDGKPMTKVISVEGMGGLGKTTLVKQVYDEGRVKKHFDCHVWVTVSQQFKLTELLKEIITKIHEEIKQPTPPNMETMSNNQLKVIIKEFLKHRRYLLVFDDVWQEQAWDSIKNVLPQYNLLRDGNRVILTTRVSQVSSASQVDFKGEILHLDALSLQDSWTLFCKKTFQGSQCPSQLTSICKQIVERCKGLPLAIVAIGGLLATKDRSRVNEWERVSRNVGGELGSSKLVSLKKILLLSYYDLPFYLRACALYLATFPEDYKIGTTRLIGLWIAERFVIEEDGRTLEEVGESYLNELIDRSLVEVAYRDQTDRIRDFRVHHILREVILSIAKEQNFVEIQTNERSKIVLAAHDQKVRRLSVHYDGTSENYEIVKSFLGLRSILMFSTVEDSAFASNIRRSLGRDNMLLTVLDLRGIKLDKFAEGVVKLYHLRYLSLRDTNVAMIPSSIEKLRNLETLDLKYTRVTRLPQKVIKLQHLRHLIVSRFKLYDLKVDSPAARYKLGFVAVRGIGSLLSLHELCTINVSSKHGKVVIGELGKLKQLRKLGILGLRAEDGMALCSSLEKLSNLCSLEIQSDGDERIIDLTNMNSPPKSLQRLLLRGRLDMVPRWTARLQNLKSLVLRGSQLKEDGTNVLESIQGLPNLMHLTLFFAFEGEKLIFKGEGFQKLKRLELGYMRNLQSIGVEKGSMPHLNELDITRCALLERVPFGIEHLLELQTLYLGYASASENLIDSIDQAKGGQDYSRVSHILRIFLAKIEDPQQYFHFGQLEV